MDMISTELTLKIKYVIGVVKHEGGERKEGGEAGSDGRVR